MNTNQLPERFSSRIRYEANGCWIWTGRLDVFGYGFFDWKKKGVKAHRFAYECLRGPIPEGLTIDHLCRNRACVNPGHMEPVTRAENIKRGTQGQHQLAKTHCPQGHEYTPENTYRYRGSRMCKVCRYERNAPADPNRRGRKGRFDGITHCIRGHLFDEANTYRAPDGRRQCRTCRAARSKRHS